MCHTTEDEHEQEHNNTITHARWEHTRQGTFFGSLLDRTKPEKQKHYYRGGRVAFASDFDFNFNMVVDGGTRRENDDRESTGSPHSAWGLMSDRDCDN